MRFACCSSLLTEEPDVEEMGEPWPLDAADEDGAGSAATGGLLRTADAVLVLAAGVHADNDPDEELADNVNALPLLDFPPFFATAGDERLGKSAAFKSGGGAALLLEVALDELDARPPNVAAFTKQGAAGAGGGLAGTGAAVGKDGNSSAKRLGVESALAGELLAALAPAAAMAAMVACAGRYVGGAGSGTGTGTGSGTVGAIVGCGVGVLALGKAVATALPGPLSPPKADATAACAGGGGSGSDIGGRNCDEDDAAAEEVLAPPPAPPRAPLPVARLITLTGMLTARN